MGPDGIKLLENERHVELKRKFRQPIVAYKKAMPGELISMNALPPEEVISTTRHESLSLSGHKPDAMIMNAPEPLTFKTASEDWEFELIHRLNYRTFVEEIPQHQPSRQQRLVDKFHAENVYLICLSGQDLVGMLAVRGCRPFSLDQKLPQLDSFLPPGRTLCEIRLLAVEKKFRGGQVLQGLLALLWQLSVEKGYDLGVISGTTRQLKLYQHLGFVPFGPLVGSRDAQFQPMSVTLETFEVAAREFLRSTPARSFHPGAVNLLPGPVAVRCAARSSRSRNHTAAMALERLSKPPNRFSANSSGPKMWNCSWVLARWPTMWSPDNWRSWANPGWC